MAAPTECLLPRCVEEDGSLKEGTFEVKKKPRRRARKDGPEVCRSAANKADFFMPVSWRKQQQKEAVQGSRGRVNEGPGDDSARSKNKRCRKENCASGVEEVVPKRIQVGKSEQDSGKAPSPVKNHIDELREVRKLAAEEDARRAPGKPMHPFFSRQAPAQSKNLKPIELGLKTSVSGGLQVPCIGELLPCPPCHVTQLEEVESGRLEWGTFRFMEACQAGIKTSDFSDNPEGSLMCRRSKSAVSSLDQVLGEFSSDKLSTYLSRHAAPENGVTGREDYFSYSFEDRLLRYLSNLSADSQELHWIQDYCPDLGDALPQERLRARAASLKARRLCKRNVDAAERKDMSFPAANSLWTDLYRPKSPLDICGNSTQVGLLNSWLASWQKKILSGRRSAQKCKGSLNDDSDEDDDKSWNRGSSSDCSDSGSDVDECLENTLLLTGPVGCGKTAAVYACAREQGFSVIEVSTVDLRNGSLIKQKFGEALESHGLRTWSSGSRSRSLDGQAVGLGNCDGRLQKHLSDTELVHFSSAKVGSDGAQGSAMLESKGRKLTVILFEDVDIIFDEDRGFTNALVKLVGTTKRPIILTSSRQGPALPLPLRKFTIEFKHPCTQNLVLHACMVINAEGVPCCPRLMECIVKACRHDIRQVMLVLQFWSQGHRHDVPSLCPQVRNREGERDGYFADACRPEGISAVVGPQRSELSTASDHFEKVRVADQSPEGYTFADARRKLHSILLPLSFPFSLLGNVTTKVSEAALQLNLCATSAGVISNQDPNQQIQVSGQALGMVKEAANGLVTDQVHDNRVGGTCFKVCTSPVKSLKGLRSVARSMKLQRLSKSCNVSEPSPNFASSSIQRNSGCETVQISGSQDKECSHSEVGSLSESASGISGATICEGGNFSMRNGLISPKMSAAVASIELDQPPDGRGLCRLQQVEKAVLESELESLPLETVGRLSGRSQVMPCDLRGDMSQCGMALDQVKSMDDPPRTGWLKTCDIDDADLQRPGLTSCIFAPASDNSAVWKGQELGVNNLTQASASCDSDSANEDRLVQLSAPESCISSLAVVATMARLADDLSFFDMMSSHSGWELEDANQEESVGRHFGFHRDSLEEEAAYLVNRSVHLCYAQCSRLMDLANSGRPRLDASEVPQGMHPAQPASESLAWLSSDANPCDLDHDIRRAAKQGMLRNIVSNLLPSRSKAVVTGPGLHDYTTSLGRMCKLEESRKAAKQIGPGLRRSGRRFLHHLAGSVPESDISALLSHADLARHCNKSCIM